MVTTSLCKASMVPVRRSIWCCCSQISPGPTRDGRSTPGSRGWTTHYNRACVLGPTNKPCHAGRTGECRVCHSSRIELPLLADFVAEVAGRGGLECRRGPLLAARSARSGGSDALELMLGTQPQRY